MQRIALVVSFAMFSATMAPAQSANCADHTVIVDRLAAGYGETRQSLGLAANNAVVEIFASTDTGTWTITVTQAGGPTCMVASGEGWQVLNETLGDTPA